MTPFNSSILLVKIGSWMCNLNILLLTKTSSALVMLPLGRLEHCIHVLKSMSWRLDQRLLVRAAKRWNQPSCSWLSPSYNDRLLVALRVRQLRTRGINVMASRCLIQAQVPLPISNDTWEQYSCFIVSSNTLKLQISWATNSFDNALQLIKCFPMIVVKSLHWSWNLFLIKFL